MFEAAGAVSLASNDKEAVDEALQKVGREPVIVLANGRDTTALMTSGAEIDVINTEALVGASRRWRCTNPARTGTIVWRRW